MGVQVYIQRALQSLSYQKREFLVTARVSLVEGFIIFLVIGAQDGCLAEKRPARAGDSSQGERSARFRTKNVGIQTKRG